MHKKQSGGSGQFADVAIKFEPGEAGTGFEFRSDIKGGVVPKEYIPGVTKVGRRCTQPPCQEQSRFWFWIACSLATQKSDAHQPASGRGHHLAERCQQAAGLPICRRADAAVSPLPDAPSPAAGSGGDDEQRLPGGLPRGGREGHPVRRLLPRRGLVCACLPGEPTCAAGPVFRVQGHPLTDVCVACPRDYGFCHRLRPARRLGLLHQVPWLAAPTARLTGCSKERRRAAAAAGYGPRVPATPRRPCARFTPAACLSACPSACLQIAARMAFREGMKKAGVQLLEPIMKVGTPPARFAQPVWLLPELGGTGACAASDAALLVQCCWPRPQCSGTRQLAFLRPLRTSPAP